MLLCIGLYVGSSLAGAAWTGASSEAMAYLNLFFSLALACLHVALWRSLVTAGNPWHGRGLLLLLALIDMSFAGIYLALLLGVDGLIQASPYLHRSLFMCQQLCRTCWQLSIFSAWLRWKGGEA